MITNLTCTWPFGGGTNRFAIIPFTQIAEKSPSVPGLYIWLIRPADSAQAKECAALLNQMALSASVKGNIRLEYSGILSKGLFIDSDLSKSNDLLDDLLPNIFFAAGYPLYIGISKNLAVRLRTHEAQFNDARASRRNGKRLSENSDVEEDSDEESEYFGARLAGMWPDALEEANLYVKLVIATRCAGKTSCTSCGRGCTAEVKSALRKSETLANSIFNPVFGRR